MPSPSGYQDIEGATKRRNARRSNTEPGIGLATGGAADGIHVLSTNAAGKIAFQGELGAYSQRIAAGSASELEYQLLLARDLAFLEDKPYQQLTGEVSEIRQMLAGFFRKLNAES